MLVDGTLSRSPRNLGEAYDDSAMPVMTLESETVRCVEADRGNGFVALTSTRPGARPRMRIHAPSEPKRNVQGTWLSGTISTSHVTSHATTEARPESDRV